MADDHTGDFVRLNATACSLCRRLDAFLEDALPPLSDAIKRAVDDEAHQRREDAVRKQRARALQILHGDPGATLEIVRSATGDRTKDAERTDQDKNT